VDSDASYKKASEIIDWLGRILKAIETRRKYWTEDLNKALKKQNDYFNRELRPPVKTAKDIMDEKYLIWRKKLEDERLKKEEEVRKKAEKIAEKQDVPVEEIMESSGVPDKLEKSDENITVKKRWTYREKNHSKVPPEYTMTISAKVNEAIRNGVREIPGLEIFEEEIISQRRK